MFSLLQKKLQKQYISQNQAGQEKEQTLVAAKLAVGASGRSETIEKVSDPGTARGDAPNVVTQQDEEFVSKIAWQGELAPQKWMNFYTKVLAKFSADKSLRLTLKVEISPESGIPRHTAEEVRVALRELGLPDHFETE